MQAEVASDFWEVVEAEDWGRLASLYGSDSGELEWLAALAELEVTVPTPPPTLAPAVDGAQADEVGLRLFGVLVTYFQYGFGCLSPFL